MIPRIFHFERQEKSQSDGRLTKAKLAITVKEAERKVRSDSENRKIPLTLPRNSFPFVFFRGLNISLIDISVAI